MTRKVLEALCLYFLRKLCQSYGLLYRTTKGGSCFPYRKYHAQGLEVQALVLN